MGTEFLRAGWISGTATGAVAAYIAMGVEPFKSHFLMAILAAIGVGCLAGIVEAGVRKIMRRR
jgi:hypothetical protein